MLFRSKETVELVLESEDPIYVYLQVGDEKIRLYSEDGYHSNFGIGLLEDKAIKKGYETRLRSRRNTTGVDVPSQTFPIKSKREGFVPLTYHFTLNKDIKFFGEPFEEAANDYNCINADERPELV